ncbi:MAG: TVP38/TMEM64 family protein [Proteobacteria bacterium]|nr:TVP38/TMEM64 family protein [Burkholderiales bacterium]
MTCARSHHGTRRQRGAIALKLALALVFIGGLAAFFLLGGPQYLSLDAIKANRDQLLALTNAHYVPALVIAFTVYVVATALSLPGSLLLSLTVGLLFGRWVGSALILLAATLGATLAFLAARYLFAEFARRKLGLDKPDTPGIAARINRGFTDNAFNYLLFLRLVPLFPFWLVNLAPAFTDVSVRTFVTATAIGILPGVFVFANLGQSLGRIESTAQLISPTTIGAFVLLGVFALVPILIRRLRAGRDTDKPASEPGAARSADTRPD